MRRRYAIVDVFTDRTFGGNPLAVVLDAEGLSDAEMQAIAIEFNYSETTFVLPPAEAAHWARVRIFTPSGEIPFAGHPNVGTASVLAWGLAERNEPMPARFVFEEDAGPVPVTLAIENGVVTGAELVAPRPLSRGSRAAPERAAACLSLDPADLRLDAHQPQVLSVGSPFLVVELSSREALARAAPNRDAFAALLPLDGARTVYAFTRATGAAAADVDIVARAFSSRMTEDPATGSATAATAAMLAENAAPPDGELTLRFRQGVEMGRPSLLAARIEIRGGKPGAVHLGGSCVAIAEGVLLAWN